MDHEGSFTLIMAAHDVVRILVSAALAIAAVLALGSWAVTSRRIPPASALGRVLRRVSDPVVVPVERWLRRRGLNPQEAPWWLLGLTVVGGIAVMAAAEWLIGVAGRLIGEGQSGPRGVTRLVVYLAGQAVLLSLIARVVGSWMGKDRSTPWLRPAFRLTDWIVEPLRRFIPPLGIIDIVPLVAWFLLQIVLAIVIGAI